MFVLVAIGSVIALGLAFAFFLDHRMKKQRGYVPDVAAGSASMFDRLAAASLEAIEVDKKQHAAAREPNHLD